MKQLKDYLGTWAYTDGISEKYWSVCPVNAKTYHIKWGDSADNLALTKSYTKVEAEEAFRRVRSKAKGGYKMVGKYSGRTYKSAELKVEDLFPQNKVSGKKSTEKKKTPFSVISWMSGMDKES